MDWKDKFLNKVVCGDCLDLLKEIPDNSVDLVITDPPYNTGMESYDIPFSLVAPRVSLNSFFDDNMKPEQYESLMLNVFKECYRVMKLNKPAYFFIDGHNVDLLKKWLVDVGFNFKQILVWDKVFHGLNYHNYAYSFELIIYVTKGEYWHKRILLKKDILVYSRVNANNKIAHKTVKPLNLIRDLIFDNSDEGNIVLDCFLGSGTTAVACTQLNRNFIGIEISPEYCQIAEQRLKAVPEKLKRWFDGYTE